MNIEAAIKDQLNQTVEQTNFPEIGEKYQGKVRDVYQSGEQLVIVTTDRVSAFDHVLGTIPFKGQILNRLAAYGFEPIYWSVKKRRPTRSSSLCVATSPVLSGVIINLAKPLPTVLIFRAT
jgi:phosphoribosylaminoimidazole-succinocarboxamide synthase